MKYLALLVCLCIMLACNQNPGSVVQSTQGNYMRFKFSKEMSTTDVRDPNNWCMGNYGESALISADPKNYFRRLFALGDIPNRIVVDMGHQSTFFMLNKVADHVELLTSENMPACLSNKELFTISPEGTAIHYDNKRAITFDVYLQELPSGIQIAIDLPSDGRLGLNVVRCESCK